MHSILAAYPAAAEQSSGWTILLMYLFLFGGVGIWYWRREAAAHAMLHDDLLDARMEQRFVPGGVFYPENKEPMHPYRRFYWAGLVLSVVGLSMLAMPMPEFLGWFLAVWGLGFSAWMFFHSVPPAEDAPAWANFQRDHLVVTGANGSRAVFVLGSRVSIVLSVVRAPTVFLGKKPPHPYRCFMVVTEGALTSRLPLEFVGSGEFLALCRKEGVAVTFAAGTPEWFVDNMEMLPTWQTDFFAAAPELPAHTVSLACSTCGAAGTYAPARGPQLCQFCGSLELHAPVRK